MNENESLTGGHVVFRAYWECFFVVFPLFAGYAALFSLQRKLGLLYFVDAPGHEDTSRLYHVAMSFVYLGNLFFRVGHNFVFALLAPRRRVQLAMLAMSVSMALLCFVFSRHLWLSSSKPSLFWVFAAYALGGTAIGTFESNLLSTIEPLGKRAKAWAIYGMPLGIVIITVGAFGLETFLTSQHVGERGLQMGIAGTYAFVFIMLCAGHALFVFHIAPSAVREAQLRQVSEDTVEDAVEDAVADSAQGAVPDVYEGGAYVTRGSIQEDGVVAAVSVYLPEPDDDGHVGNVQAFGMRRFVRQVVTEHWRWFPIIRWACAALLVDMFFVSLFSPGVLLFVYTDPLPLHIGTGEISSDGLKTIYNAMFCLGDTSGRRFFYDRQRIFPFFFLGLTVIGIACGLSNFALAIPLCGFLVAFCNGAIYAQTARLIDQEVPRDLNLTATSMWLFVGDLGSVTGSNLIPVVTKIVSSLPWFAK